MPQSSVQTIPDMLDGVETIMNSLCTDSVIMKPRCVSSSSNGSLESNAQICVHDIAVLTTRCNTRTSTTWQVVGASCRRCCIARLEHPTCLATCSVNMPASSINITHSHKLLGILGILKMLQCKKIFNCFTYFEAFSFT